MSPAAQPVFRDEADTDRSPRAAAGVLEDQIAATKALAAQCDGMCVDAGSDLGKAVPGLHELSVHFSSLAAMLEGQDMTTATQSLDRVAGEVAALGTGLTSERKALDGLVVLNRALSRQIVSLADDVRFLSAMVCNVKIELAAIDDEGERLQGFAKNLEQLTTNAQNTLGKYQEMHKAFLDQLRRTVLAQSAFESSHQTKLITIAHDIEASLDVVSARRRTIADGAAEIGSTAQKISAQIALSVVAMQIGDSTRQRIEHACEALSTVADVLVGRDVAGLEIPPFDPCADEVRLILTSRVSHLQSIQLAQAREEFSSEIGTISSLLAQIIASMDLLVHRSDDLFGSKGETSGSFLSDLEVKLDVAQQLIDQCKRSRVSVDVVADTVVSTIVTLEQLASKVEAMATDMTIIGTNAIVTCYRLGARGAALSIIAQQLRSQALRVADGVKVLGPALKEVLKAAHQFTAAREGQSAASMAAMSDGVTVALGLFKSCDRTLSDMRQKLGREASDAEVMLRQAMNGLAEIDGVDRRLDEVASALSQSASSIDEGSGASDLAVPSLDQLLRKRYTMASERVAHDAFFATAGSPALVSLQDDDGLF